LLLTHILYLLLDPAVYIAASNTVCCTTGRLSILCDYAYMAGSSDKQEKFPQYLFDN
jgi:hypothetical protein